MSWFSRHLNWSFVLGLLVANIVAGIVGFLTFFLLFLLFPYGSWETLEVPVRVVVTLLCLVWTFLVGSWVLKHKGRSQWNLLWLLLPWIGLIVFLFLENRKAT